MKIVTDTSSCGRRGQLYIAAKQHHARRSTKDFREPDLYISKPAAYKLNKKLDGKAI